jgi:hypothetical protein
VQSNRQRRVSTEWPYVSTDGGATWKLAANGMPSVVRQRLDDVDFGPGALLYASSHHGVYALSLLAK